MSGEALRRCGERVRARAGGGWQREGEGEGEGENYIYRECVPSLAAWAGDGPVQRGAVR